MTDLHYIVGASVGDGSDSTAIAIIEQEITQDARYRPVTHIHRLRWLDLDDGAAREWSEDLESLWESRDRGQASELAQAEVREPLRSGVETLEVGIMIDYPVVVSSRTDIELHRCTPLVASFL